MAAGDFDKQKHSHLQFYCNDCWDKGHYSRHYPVSGHDTHKTTQDGTVRKFSVPPHFAKWPAPYGKDHLESCAYAHRHSRHEKLLRDLNAVRDQDGMAAFRVTIPLMAPPKAPPAAAAFTNKVKGETEGRGTPRGSSRTDPHKSLTTLQKMEAFIKEAVYDPFLRAQTLIRDDRLVCTLDEFYCEKPDELFRRAHGAAKSGQDSIRQIVDFTPNRHPRFWREEGIPSVSRRIQGHDGNRYEVVMRLQPVNGEMRNALLKAIQNNPDKNLLVYGAAKVDLAEFAQKKRDILTGQAQDHAIFVDIPVNRAEQFKPWTPPAPIRSLDFGSAGHGAQRERKGEPEPG